MNDQIRTLTKPITHLVLPGYEKARVLPLEGETISAFIERNGWEFKLPTICVVNKEPVPRAEWGSLVITQIDEVTFLSKPFGDGGGGGASKWASVIGLVAIVALTAFAPYLAGLAAGALGVTSTAGIALIQAGIVIGGSLLISTLIQAFAGGQAKSSDDKISQLYSFGTQSNAPRPFQSIPVNYGRSRLWPDLAAPSWTEYISNEQYLNVMLVVGVGKHQHERVQIGDNVLWNSSSGYNPEYSVTIQFCPPGTPVTLFASNVYQSPDVNGIELLGTDQEGYDWVGAFVTNPPGTQCTQIALDYGFPGGLYGINDKGEQYTLSVILEAWGRPLDDFGIPVGDWFLLDYWTVSMSDRQPKRYTRVFSVSAGRYEVRARRTNPAGGGGGSFTFGPSGIYATGVPPEKHTQVDSTYWLGMRAFLKDADNVFEHEDIIAIRIRATAQITQATATQFNTISTRILNVWNGSAFVEAATRNPIWAFWDAATNPLYGARRPASRIDFPTIVSAATAAASRGDTFNYSFKSTVPVPQAFDTILAAVRSKHCWVGDYLTVVRDEWHAIPEMLLTDNQIVRGSLQITQVFNSEDSADCVIGEFVNEDTWRPAELQYPPNSQTFSANQPARIQLQGITNRHHLWRELSFWWRQSQLRRSKVVLSTEHDGRMLRLLTPVKIQTFLPRTWGQSGEIVSKALDGLTITTNKELVWKADVVHYIEFRDKTGRYFGPIKCDPVTNQPMRVRLNASDLSLVESQYGTTLDAVLDRMDGSEAPSFVFGAAGNLSRNCIVMSGRPEGHRVELSLVVDVPEVHDGSSSGDTPDVPVSNLPTDPPIPVISMPIVVFRQGIAEPIIDASWWPAPGAYSYIAQVSYDNKLSWKTIYEGTDFGFSVGVQPTALIVRIAAIGNVHGPWVEVALEAPTIQVWPGVVAPSSLKPALEDWVMSRIKETDDALRAIQQIISSAAADHAAVDWLSTAELRREVFSTDGVIFGRITEVMEVSTDNTKAIAQLTTTVEAGFEDVTVFIEETFTVFADSIDNKLAAGYAMTLDVDGYISGMKLLSDGTLAGTIFSTDVFQIATTGFAPQTVFQVGTSNGVASVVIKGSLTADDSITAAKINVSELSAINGNVGTLIAGVIMSPDGKWYQDITNGRLEVYD